MPMSKSRLKTKSATIKRGGKPAAKPKKGPGGAPRRAPSASRLRPRSPRRSDDADAFLPDPRGGPARTSVDLAEVLAEDFVEAATSGNAVFEDELGRALPDEVGGPFVVTDADEELADDVDASNPPDAEVAGLPTAVAGLVQLPRDEAVDEDEDDEGRPR